MLLSLGALILGSALLYFGAEWLVLGAAGIALRLGVRPLLIGLTVVSYATSAPELAVCVVAALGDDSAISLGNVVGSNIANIGLILGITALIRPPSVDGSMGRRELLILLAATALLPVLLIDGAINRTEAALLLIGAVSATLLSVRWSLTKGPAEVEAQRAELPEPPTGRRGGALLAIALAGLGVLIIGGEVSVRGAVDLAENFGISQRVIGLTVVAVGTSLPELAASVVAALRGHAELALGNVVGSNVFNLLLILGATAAISPIAGSLGELRLDLTVLGAFTLLAFFLLRKPGVLSRWAGGLLTLSYCGFLAALVWTTFR